MSKENKPQICSVERVIRPTVLGGWKGSAFTAFILLIFFINAMFNGDAELMLAFICAACGWGGWAIQEYQHLKGFLIKNT